MNFLRVRITGVKYTNNSEFDSYGIVHANQRTMDRFSSKAVYLAQSLFELEENNTFVPERVGVILCTYTGPLQSVREHAEILLSKGYRGINPSRFPNTMLSTALSMVMTALQAKGPSTALYVDDSIAYAVRYAMVQLEKETCDLMLFLLVNENSDDFGMCLRK